MMSASNNHLSSVRHESMPQKANAGFTLLEVLVAITITAMIGLGAWQLFNGAIRSNELTEARMTELRGLKKAMLFLQRDFQQVVPRAIRDEYGDKSAALKSETGLYSVEFTRLGWRNPLQDKRPELQRVAYELSSGELIRHYWMSLDRAQDSQPVSRTLLTEVESFQLAYLNESDAWIDSWPPDQADTTNSIDPMLPYNQLPKAIRVNFEHTKFGQIVRLFDLVSYVENTQGAAANIGAGNSGNGANDDADASNPGASDPEVNNGAPSNLAPAIGDGDQAGL